MPNPPSLPNLQISPQTFNLVEDIQTQIQLTLTTSSQVAFNAGYSICFDFPSSWSVVPTESNWTYAFDSSIKLGVLTSNTAITFPYALSLQLTCNSQQASENISVYLSDNNLQSITNPTNIFFDFLASGVYLLAYTTNSVYYFNSGSTELLVNNTLTSALSFTDSNTQTYQVGIKIDFYTHDKLGNVEQISVENNANFSILVGSVNAKPDSARKTWKAATQTISGEDSLAVSVNNFNQSIAGKLLEVRFTVDGVQKDPYQTSAFYQIMGPFSISISIDLSSSATTAKKASKYCLSGDSLQGYTFGTLEDGADQPPYDFNVLDQFGTLIDPTAYQIDRLLNGEQYNDAPLNAENILALQTLNKVPLTVLPLNMQTIDADELPTGWAQVKEYLCGPSSNLSGLNLSGCDLTSVVLTNSNLSGTNLSNTNLSFVDMSGTNLTAYLEGQTLYSTNLSGANMEGVNLTNITSSGITGTPGTMPINWQLINSCLVGPEVDLVNMHIEPQTSQNVVVDFSNANLENANLSGANFTGNVKVYNTESGVGENIFYAVSLNNASLSGANLAYASSGGIIGTPTSLPNGWQLINGYLVGPNANLSGADLSQQDLTTANMSDVNLIGSNLNQTIFSYASSAAVLDYVTSGGITGVPYLPSSWQLVNGYLIGPKANLINADLSNADLSSADLSYAQLVCTNLSGTNLSNATLTGVVSGNIVGTPSALPTGWAVVNGCLVGP